MWRLLLTGFCVGAALIEYKNHLFIGCEQSEIVTSRDSCIVRCEETPECRGVSVFPAKCNMYMCEGAQLRSTRPERQITSFLKRTPSAIPSDNCTDPFWSKLGGVRIANFAEVSLTRDICEIVQPFPGSSLKTERDFPCGLETCVSWCEVNTACLAVMFKPGTCVLLASPQRTDTSPEMFAEWVLSEWQVYQKYPNFKIPYYSQLCAEIPRQACRGKCGWGKGKPGFNRPIYGGFEGQWCGRVSC